MISHFNAVDIRLELGLIGGVSRLDDVLVPKPRPTAIDTINRILHRTKTLTSLWTELSSIASDTVDLLLVFVDAARVEKSVA
jgi:hypothetical protein